MEFTAGLMPLETALSQMLSRITPLTAVETLPLVQCFGRILATDVISPIDVPAHMPLSSPTGCEFYAHRR